MSGKVISVISTKGSVGKTTLTIHMAGYLASLGKKILLIDCDSQQSLSKFWDYEGLDANIPHNGFAKWLINRAPSSEVIRRTVHDDPNLIIDVLVNDDPSKKRVSMFLRDSVGSIYRLATLVRPLREKYDYIFLDTEGTDGRDHNGYSIQNSVLLAEPDLVLSFTKTKLAFAMEALRVVDVYNKALEAYDNIDKSHYQPAPLKFVINDHDRSISLAKVILGELQESFEGPLFKDAGATLCKTIVPTRRAFFENFLQTKQFMHEYKDRSVHEHLDVVIRELCEELFPEIKDSLATQTSMVAEEV